MISDDIKNEVIILYPIFHILQKKCNVTYLKGRKSNGKNMSQELII